MNTTGLQNIIDTNVSSHPIQRQVIFGFKKTRNPENVVDNSTSPFDVFGMSVDLGQVTTATNPVVWAIGVTRDPSIQFTMLSPGDVRIQNSY